MKATLPHILIVDDDTRLRNLIRQYLLDNNFIIATAENADHARQILKSMRFDLIILDVMMPSETGFEFLSSLRKTSQIPVLMLTAQNEISERITGLESGADDYLAKPFEPKELVLRVKSILKRSLEVTAKQIQGLTSAEQDLLNILSTSKGEIVERTALAAQLGNISERAVDVQVTRLRKKLADLGFENLYIQTIRGIGYRLDIS